MKLNLYYVVKELFDDHTPMSDPLYQAGPFPSHSDALDYIAGQWLNNNCFCVVTQTIDVEQFL
mgnify:CR=1 FL=1